MGWAIKNQSVILSTKHDTGDAYQPTAGPWDFWVGANTAVVAGRGNVFEDVIHAYSPRRYRMSWVIGPSDRNSSKTGHHESKGLTLALSARHSIGTPRAHSRQFNHFQDCMLGHASSLILVTSLRSMKSQLPLRGEKSRVLVGNWKIFKKRFFRIFAFFSFSVSTVFLSVSKRP